LRIQQSSYANEEKPDKKMARETTRGSTGGIVTDPEQDGMSGYYMHKNNKISDFYFIWNSG